MFDACAYHDLLVRIESMLQTKKEFYCLYPADIERHKLSFVSSIKCRKRLRRVHASRMYKYVHENLHVTPIEAYENIGTCGEKEEISREQYIDWLR